MLEARLDCHRATLALKCQGFDDARLRHAPVPPWAVTLLGPVQHPAGVERAWLQRVFAGRDLPLVYEAAAPVTPPGA